jgi:hypothetical protein
MSRQPRLVVLSDPFAIEGELLSVWLDTVMPAEAFWCETPRSVAPSDLTATRQTLQLVDWESLQQVCGWAVHSRRTCVIVRGTTAGVVAGLLAVELQRRLGLFDCLLVWAGPEGYSSII